MNPPEPPATSIPLRAKRPNRRRKRSESDRKKHAGWRSCPRCTKSVSTNGRNFYHHMHKCDPVFFADLIARVDMKRTQTHVHPPAPTPPTAAQPIPTPTTPLRTPLPTRSVRGCLSETQHVVFLQQLCFLRTYDTTVDAVFRRVESNPSAVWGMFSTAIFQQIRLAKRDQMRYIATPNPAPSQPNDEALKQSPPSLSSPLSSHSPPVIPPHPTTLPPSPLQSQTRPPSTMSISSVINN